MTENALLVLGEPETHLLDILGPSMTEKIMVEVRARKISGSSRLRWVVGAERCTEGLCVSLVHVRACVRGIGL